MAPTRARITKITPSVHNGKVGKGPEIKKFDVQFNPKEYSIQKSATWEYKPSKSAEKTVMPEWKGANSAELTVELFLDATESSPTELKTTIEELFDCCTPLAKSKQLKKPSPPFVILEWGTLKFTGTVKSVAAKHTLFNEKGQPLRATCTLSLQELPTEGGKTNPTSGALERTSSHRVVAGDTLASVAWEEYQDPALWRHLAAVNGIDDPMRLREGAMVLVPPPDASGD